jgi:hypothetical protein
MNAPNLPGDMWTKGPAATSYHQLPRARRDAVNREVDRIFAARTGVTRTLDPERDRTLVRIWLRIRDAVMAGDVQTAARMFVKVDDVAGSSADPRTRGWLDLVDFDLNPHGASNQAELELDPGKSQAAFLALAQDQAAGRFRTIWLRISSPRLAFTATLHNARTLSIQAFGPRVRVRVIFMRIEFLQE